MDFTSVDSRAPGLDVVFEKSYENEMIAARASPEALVGAWSEGLTQTLTSLEADLRARCGRAKRRRARPRRDSEAADAWPSPTGRSPSPACTGRHG